VRITKIETIRNAEHPNAPNALVQESVRAFCRTWHRDLVAALSEVKHGMISASSGQGLAYR
jgi:hypothetical protein